MHMKLESLLTGLVIFLSLQTSHARGMGSGMNKMNRCGGRNQLSHTYEVWGRNAWAAKCGYISSEEQASFNEKEQYIVFSEYNAPTDPDATCGDGIHPLTLCYKGCFTASQRLVFSNEFIPIAQAVKEQVTTVTTLSKGSTIHQMNFSDIPIDFFVVGVHHGGIVVFTDINRSQIEVTKNHPMVYATGDTVRADEVKVGESLLTILGASVITAIRHVNYEGQVLNVSPVSEAVEEHITLGERFLTGSVRFQNEWADVEHRMLLRKTINPQGL